LLQVEYSPAAALNRTYALAQVQGAAAAIVEAKKLDLGDSHLHDCLMGELYAEIDPALSQSHWRKALQLAKTAQDRRVILGKCGGR
jgi:predicted RNA polymerase sigma factor